MSWFPLRVVKRIVSYISSGATDVNFVDSTIISDSLAGTLGPVNALDSVDISDRFVVRTFNVQDSTAIDDLFVVSTFNVQDSIGLSSTLSGTLGPVNAADSLALSELFVLSTFNVQDSANLATAPDHWVIAATQPDSLTISDIISHFSILDDSSLRIADQFGTDITRIDDSIDMSSILGMITAMVQDSLALPSDVHQQITLSAFLDSTDISEALATLRLKADDSVAISDLLTAITNLILRDSLNLGTTPSTWMLAPTAPDSLAIGDTLHLPIVAKGADSAAIGDFRSKVTLANANLWPNTAPTSTNWATPANMTDTNTGTAATLTATSSASLVTQNNVNVTGDLIVQSPDVAGEPLTLWNITSVFIQYNIVIAQTTATLGTPGTISLNVQYSINDGTSWTTLETLTATGTFNRNTDMTSAIGGGAVTYTSPAWVAGTQNSTSGGGNTSLAINKPAGVTTGHLMVANIWDASAGGPAIVPPAGWNTVYNPSNARACFWRIADASDASVTSYTFTKTASINNFSGSIAAFSGFDPNNPIQDAQTGANATTASLAVASGTSSYTQSLLVDLVWVNNNTNTATPPGSMTSRTLTRTGTVNQQFMATEAVSSGATGSRTWTIDASTSVAGASFIVNPDPATAVTSGGQPPSTQWDRINKFRFRIQGTIGSGSGTLTACSTTVSAYYERLVINAEYTP